MKPKPLLALNHFTVPCSLLTALLFSVSRFTAAHIYIELSDAASPEPLYRASAVFGLVSGTAKRSLKQKRAASVTLRPLTNPKAIQEQQTQKQITTTGLSRQVDFLPLCAELDSAILAGRVPPRRR